MNDNMLKLAIYLFENLPLPSYEDLELDSETYLSDISEKTGLSPDEFAAFYIKHRTQYDSLRSDFLAGWTGISTSMLMELVQDEIANDEIDFVAVSALQRRDDLSAQHVEYIAREAFKMPRNDSDTMLPFAIVDHKNCSADLKAKVFETWPGIEKHYQWHLHQKELNVPVPMSGGGLYIRHSNGGGGCSG